MRFLAFASVLAFTAPVLAQAPAPAVSLSSLLHELVDLDRLARLPAPAYHTVQFGSTDRRTSTPDAPGWFSNADGFGREPIPGFVATVTEPGKDGIGEFLVCDLDGPGAIVRGWSAGMDGVLRVWLDGAEQPLFLGKAYDFFARRTAQLLPQVADLGEPAIAKALEPQQDADYLPIPFEQHLRITWQGRIDQLHFYHLQVRRYAAGTKVKTFDPHELANWQPQPAAAEPTALIAQSFELPVDGTWQYEEKAKAPAACRELGFTVEASDLWRALRGVLLRIRCDGASVPQVEAPIGDFFASAPGLTPLLSLPIDVTADGALVCRWVMPYRASWQVELLNWSGIAVRGAMSSTHGSLPGGFTDDTLYFHARWRVDHELFARGGAAPIDLPYLVAIGRGRLVGLGCQIVNPPMSPAWRSNWWGEGDERIAVDGALDTFGTGSEDFYNYSWSHWNYFAHPYCGQPVSSGPGNCGYASNHRLQIIDDLPFTQSLWATCELWSHKPAHPVTYGRIAWFYARPFVLTDHRGLQPDELRVPSLPAWREADFAATKTARTWRPGAVEGGVRAVDGTVTPELANRWTRSGAILSWQAPPGGQLSLPFAIAEAGDYALRVSLQQRPYAPAVLCAVDGEPQAIRAQARCELGCVHGERFEDFVFGGLSLTAGEHVLTITCPDGGTVGLDLVGYERSQPKPKALPGASEAETWAVVSQSAGVELEVQGLGDGWSSGQHRWVKATAVGQQVTFRVPATGKKGKVVLRLTTSRDYGIVAIDWNGQQVVKDVDLWGGPDRGVNLRELDLGERDLSQPVELRFTVTGHHPDNEAPHCYFGVDCLLVR